MWPRRLLLAALAGLASACGGDDLDRLADGGRGRVAQAMSGETLRLEDGRTVRLAGVDAPSPMARAALQDLAAGREVALLHGGERLDGYGRVVAHVRLSHGRRWLQGALLDAGHARVRTVAGDTSLAPEMLRREAAARSRERGLWSAREHRVRLPEEVASDPAGFLIVEGRVGRLERLGDRLFLDFGEGRRGFSVEIPRRALPDFEAAGLEVETLRGRLIRVRGYVRPTRFGPTMHVDHPEQIERLRQSG